jgi:hypothetical protein
VQEKQEKRGKKGRCFSFFGRRQQTKKEASEEEECFIFRKEKLHTQLIKRAHKNKYYVSKRAQLATLLFCRYFCAISYGVRANLRF